MRLSQRACRAAPGRRPHSHLAHRSRLRVGESPEAPSTMQTTEVTLWGLRELAFIIAGAYHSYFPFPSVLAAMLKHINLCR